VNQFTRSVAGLASVIVLAAVGPAPLHAQDLRAEIEGIVKDYLSQHPEDVQGIVKDYLVKHPEVLQEALSEMLKKGRPAAANVDNSKVIKSNEALLFGSPRQVILGNRDGDVTMVEFFDYNCGFCKRALSDMQTLLKDDPKLKFVLKEFPILGPGSTEDPGGEKYLAFHQKLLGARGPANKDSALAAAKDAGLDVARLEVDMASDEVAKTLQESAALARALGINGTPGYVIGDSIVPGAIGAAALKERVQSARSRRPS
jgi:protein-disulfide isomerase